MNKLRRIALALAVCGLGWLGWLGKPAAADVTCHDAGVFSGKLISDICWECLYPLRISGVTLGGKWGAVPDEAHNEPLCICNDEAGLPMLGVTTSMWEPSFLVEFQHTPGCSSALGGIKLGFDQTNRGVSSGTKAQDEPHLSFLHYHWFSFPILSILDLFNVPGCDTDGYMDFDLMFLSEVDPTWNNDDLAFFTTPESALVANPIAIAACAADAVAATAGKPLKSMFWCAGSWGGIYPLSGHTAGAKGIIWDTSLYKARVLATLHRRGMARGTMGKEAMCDLPIKPTLPKTQYKFTLFHPVAETSRAHWFGESVLRWGINRVIPAVGEDPLYVIWRWKDCCAL